MLTEGSPAVPIGNFIMLMDEDSTNSNVTVNEVTVSVQSEVELLFLLESDPDITEVCYIIEKGGIKTCFSVVVIGNTEHCCRWFHLAEGSGSTRCLRETTSESLL